MKRLIRLFTAVCFITIIFVGCVKSENDKAEKIANKFITELYTVDDKEIENYNNLLNMDIKDTKQLSEAIQTNDTIIKTLMTVEAYEKLFLNRQNLKFAYYCEKGNYTMQISKLTLSEKTFSKEKNKAEYDVDINLSFISNNDNIKQTDVGKCNIWLTKENGQWKISGYREIKLPYTFAHS